MLQFEFISAARLTGLCLTGLMETLVFSLRGEFPGSVIKIIPIWVGEWIIPGQEDSLRLFLFLNIFQGLYLGTEFESRSQFKVHGADQMILREEQ